MLNLQQNKANAIQCHSQAYANIYTYLSSSTHKIDSANKYLPVTCNQEVELIMGLYCQLSAA